MDELTIINSAVLIGIAVYLFVKSIKDGDTKNKLEKLESKGEEAKKELEKLKFIVEHPAEYKVGDVMQESKVVNVELKEYISSPSCLYGLSARTSLYYWSYECYDKKENKIVFNTEDSF